MQYIKKCLLLYTLTLVSHLWCNYHNSGHYPISCLLSKTMFWRLDSFRVQVQPTKLGPIDIASLPSLPSPPLSPDTSKVYLKHDISETGFCLRVQVELTQLDAIDRASLCLRTPATTPIRFIKPTQHKPPLKVNIFHTLNLHTCGA
jgi:hypothetical protein